MSEISRDAAFSDSIPQLYEQYLVPLIFQPYADDLAARVAAHQPRHVLELASGTGVVTRCLSEALPEPASIVATDLNQAMIDEGARIGTSRPVRWQQADAMQIPFDDETFDVVVCQFGVMFFPDKARAYAEARRVLRPGGVFIFSTWDAIEHNEFAETISRSLEPLFAEDPPRFLDRVPYAYNAPERIARDLEDGGFSQPQETATIAARSIAASARTPATAFCQGTPLRAEIEARDASRLQEATDAASEALVRRFGAGLVDAKIQAHVIVVKR